MAKAPTKTPATSRPAVTLRLALYARVSTEEQADRDTIQAQVTFLRQWAQLYDFPIVGEYTDDGVSGTLPLPERPGATRLLAAAQVGAFDAVAIYRVDRFARSLRVLLDGHNTLEACGVTLKSATEPFDSATPMGKFLLQLLGSMAELERSTILERTSLGRDRLVQACKWLGGPIPRGYCVDADGFLLPSERLIAPLGLTEADMMRDLYQRLANGSSGVAEAARLQALGVPFTRYYRNGASSTTAAATHWRSTKVTTLIQSTIYKGIHTFKSRFGPITREVPALVSPALWDAANAQIQRNRALPKTNATRVYLLRGLIRCGLCGKRYVGQVVHRRRRQTAYYRCNGAQKSPVTGMATRCPGRVLHTAHLEAHIWARCKGFIVHPQRVLEALTQQLAATPAVETPQQEHALALALAEKQQDEERLLTVFRRGRITLAAFEAEMDQIDREKAALQAELAALQAQQKRQHARVDYLRHSQTLLETWRTKLAGIEAADDRAAMHALIADFVAGITVYPDRVEIEYRFDGEDMRGAESGTGWSSDLCTTLTETWPVAA